MALDESVGHFKLLDGSTVSVTRTEFLTNPQLQQEVAVAGALEEFDKSLAQLSEFAEIRPRIQSALERLCRYATNENDIDLWALVLRLTCSHSVLEEVDYLEFGEWQIDTSTAVFESRALFSKKGRQDLERDLSLIATTQFSCLEARSDYDVIARGISDFAAQSRES